MAPFGRGEKKARIRAFKREKRTHLWLLGVLLVIAMLVGVYEFATGALSLETMAGFLFAIVLIAFVADVIHRRNVKSLRTLKLVLAIFCACVIGSAFVSAPVAHAYSFASGAVTSANGEITVSIPYVTPPSLYSASAQYIGSIPLLTVSSTELSLTWFENTVVNLVIDVGNALIYVVNIVLGFLVAIVAAVIGIPVYLFNAISVTTLGPVVDFLSFVPAAWAWIVTGVVWAIALTEWVIIIIALVRLARVAIGAAGSLMGQEEESLKEDTAEVA